MLKRNTRRYSRFSVSDEVIIIADFQTEISRNYTRIIVVISCPSREDLDDYIEDDFFENPTLRELLKDCEWEDVTKSGGRIF